MTRARCNHCDGVFVVGEPRDCCLKGAVAEQNRLRSQVARLRHEASLADVMASVRDLAGGRA